MNHISIIQEDIFNHPEQHKFSFWDKDYHPDVPGIYFVMNASSYVLYVGQTKNFKDRWHSTNHHKENDCLIKGATTILLLVYRQGNLFNIETYYKNLLKPPLNDKPQLVKKVQKTKPEESNRTDESLVLTALGLPESVEDFKAISWDYTAEAIALYKRLNGKQKQQETL